MKFLAGMHLCLYVHCRQHDCDRYANLTFQKPNSPALCVRVKRSCVFLLSILTIFLILYLKWHFAPPFFLLLLRGTPAPRSSATNLRGGVEVHVRVHAPRPCAPQEPVVTVLG